MNKRAKKILFLLFTAVFCFAIALPSIFAVPSQSVSPEVFSAYEIEAGLVPKTSANQATDGKRQPIQILFVSCAFTLTLASCRFRPSSVWTLGILF